MDNPVAALGHIAKFLGVETCEQTLIEIVRDFTINEMKSKEPQGNRSSAEKGHQYFIGDGKSGIWSEILSPESSKEIIEFSGMTMRRFGYI